MELIQNTNNNINLTEEIKNFIDFKFKDLMLSLNLRVTIV